MLLIECEPIIQVHIRYKVVHIKIICFFLFYSFIKVTNDPTSIANRSHGFELSRLKKQLNDYEKELGDRQGRILDLEKQMRGFLDKNYELRDAVQEIRQLKEQLKLKDRQIEDLAQYASRNDLTVHEVTDENEELRAKLGLDPRTPMTVEELKTARMTRSEANQAVVQVLQKEVRRKKQIFSLRTFNCIQYKNTNSFFDLMTLKN